MNDLVIKEIAQNLGIAASKVNTVLELLAEGNTIPFIARYRKEATGALDEEQIRKINEVYEYSVNLLKRKEDVIRLIEEKEMMTEDLRNQILNASKLVEVEDLYRPFKEKKKTKATEAIALGLEPLAKLIMEQPNAGSIEILAKDYVNDKVKTIEEAVTGAKYIIAEMVSDNAFYRGWIRKHVYQNGNLVSKVKKDASEEGKVYEMYYEHKEPVKWAKPHRIMAMNRGEKEKVLNVSIDIENEKILDYLKSKVIKNSNSYVNKLIEEAIADSYKRLIWPSIEREIRSELSEKSEEVAIDNFGQNLEKLLMQPPMKEKMVLAVDPAFRTGCKLAVLNNTGKEEAIAVIYPHEPKNDWDKSKKVLLEMIAKHNIDIIAIGNGTASRETEKLIAETIKEASHKLEYIIVSEAGASVYSASKLAAEEFPNLDVSERSAISIGRRLQDPLSELVKIDPKSIGVGLYQHDVSPKKLTESLDFVVTKAVNSVGVNINTASSSLLKYVSGLTKRNIDKIVEYRNSNGKIVSREQLLKKKILTDKIYEQAVGFLRVLDGPNMLDMTDIHPESYEATLKLLQKLELTNVAIGSEKMNEALRNVSIDELSSELQIDRYTLTDIVLSLQKPGRDPRDMIAKPLLRSDILQIEDLTVGMALQGTVRNVAPFGVFIDIGLKNDGLAHISRLSKDFIKHPMDVVSVGDIVTCYVYEIHLEKKQVALSLIAPGKQ